MKNETNLKTYRRKTPLLQQDVAFLLKIDNGLYCKIEKGKRPPTLDIILIFHLFGANVNQLFSHEFEALKETIITQSKKRIEQLETEQLPKSNIRIAYLKRIVKLLRTENDE